MSSSTAEKNEKGIAVPFSFSFLQTGYPKSGRGSRNGLSCQIRSSGVASLRIIEEVEAPVVASLFAPDGASLDIRISDGKFMRPVRKPGTFRPCDVGEFMRFAKGDWAWRDSPFNPPIMPFIRTVSLHKDASDRDSYDFASWGENTEEARDFAECHARMATYAIIGGHVYMECAEPVLEIKVARTGSRKVVAVGWTVAMGEKTHPYKDMSAFDSHADAWGGTPMPPDLMARPDDARDGKFRPFDPVEQAPMELFARFPLTRRSDAEACAVAFSKDIRARFDGTAGVDVIEPSVFSQGLVVRDMLAYLVDAFPESPHMNRANARLRDAVRNAAIEALQTKDAAKAQAAFALAAEIQSVSAGVLTEYLKFAANPQVWDSVSKAQAMALGMPFILARWKAVESHRDVAADLSPPPQDEVAPDADLEGLRSGF